MVIDIKMCRFDNVPWGFRLVGGADFEIPLTVVKVNEGSIADEAGMRVGDVIVRINDTATSSLSHDEAHAVILKSGNVFYFGIFREDEMESPKHFPLICVEQPLTSETHNSLLEDRSPTRSPNSLVCSEKQDENNSCEIGDRSSCPNTPDTNGNSMLDDDIAAVMSGESEVLKEHNVIGIFPKPGVCQSSEVLRQLNEEAIKTKLEKEKEKKKWTTFMQKPDRPIPKSKAELEAEARRANAYKVKIVKQPPATQKRSVSPAVVKIEPEPMIAEPEKEPTPPPEENEEPPTDNEVPNLEETSGGTQENEETFLENSNAEPTSNEDEASNETSVPEQEETSKTFDTDEEVIEEKQQKLEKTKDELLLEKQLADVQKQLLALSTLPSTIQATLDAVTRQLSELLPTFKLQVSSEQSVKAIEECNHYLQEEKVEIIEDNNGELIVDANDVHLDEIENCETADRPNSVEIDDELTIIAAETDNFDMELFDPIKRGQSLLRQEETRKMEEEQKIKKQKKYDVIEELEGRLERDHGPKRSKRAFGPLTPQERPLVLPGGRRWYRPKDAYNDEFIAETLSAQAELITGSTLGDYNSASVAVQLESTRVNFMKYQKPEKKIDLEQSEVYKVVHHLDRRPIRGIEIRPPVVAAEIDIRRAIHS